MFDNFRFDIFFVWVIQLLTAYVIFGLFAWKKYLTMQVILLRNDLVTLALKISEIDSKLNNKEDGGKEVEK